MSRGEGSILVSPPGGSWREDGHEGEGFVSRGEGSILVSPLRGPWREYGLGGDGIGNHGLGSIRAFSFPPRGSEWGLFGESETALVFSGFLDGSWAGHKLSAVFGNSLRDSGRIELGDEGPGVVGGCREGLG